MNHIQPEVSVPDACHSGIHAEAESETRPAPIPFSHTDTTHNPCPVMHTEYNQLTHSFAITVIVSEHLA